jgi:hypothetical protein
MSDLITMRQMHEVIHPTAGADTTAMDEQLHESCVKADNDVRTIIARFLILDQRCGLVANSTLAATALRAQGKAAGQAQLVHTMCRVYMAAMQAVAEDQLHGGESLFATLKEANESDHAVMKVIGVLKALRTFLETSDDARALRQVAKVVITAAVPEMEDPSEWLQAGTPTCWLRLASELVAGCPHAVGAVAERTYQRAFDADLDECEETFGTALRNKRLAKPVVAASKDARRLMHKGEQLPMEYAALVLTLVTTS